MKAMILAAGLGTRLQHFTKNKPKALVEIKGKTLLEKSIEKLIRFGVDDIIINIHHFASQIIDFVNTHSFSARISFSDESECLLDTGGGLKKAASFFNDKQSFFLYNVDIISDIDLNKMYQYHLQQKSLATLAVKNRKTQRYLLFDNNMRLCGRYNTKTEEKTLLFEKELNYKQFAFSGIHVISPEIFTLMPQENIFSITDLYLQLATNHLINGYDHSDDFWMDMGKIQSLDDIEKTNFI
ncbi:MAG TPA: nucleotidyltransferase family protein [Bacteroidales bacterium]|nr:nucleotidyltransferase family protein [Bacteroidales bacterium]